MNDVCLKYQTEFNLQTSLVSDAVTHISKSANIPEKHVWMCFGGWLCGALPTIWKFLEIKDDETLMALTQSLALSDNTVLLAGGRFDGNALGRAYREENIDVLLKAFQQRDVLLRDASIPPNRFNNIGGILRAFGVRVLKAIGSPILASVSLAVVPYRVKKWHRRPVLLRTPPSILKIVTKFLAEKRSPWVAVESDNELDRLAIALALYFFPYPFRFSPIIANLGVKRKTKGKILIEENMHPSQAVGVCLLAGILEKEIGVLQHGKFFGNRLSLIDFVLSKSFERRFFWSNLSGEIQDDRLREHLKLGSDNVSCSAIVSNQEQRVSNEVLVVMSDFPKFGGPTRSSPMNELFESYYLPAVKATVDYLVSLSFQVTVCLYPDGFANDRVIAYLADSNVRFSHGFDVHDKRLSVLTYPGSSEAARLSLGLATLFIWDPYYWGTHPAYDMFLTKLRECGLFFHSGLDLAQKFPNATPKSLLLTVNNQMSRIKYDVEKIL